MKNLHIILLLMLAATLSPALHASETKAGLQKQYFALNAKSPEIREEIARMGSYMRHRPLQTYKAPSYSEENLGSVKFRLQYDPEKFYCGFARVIYVNDKIKNQIEFDQDPDTWEYLNEMETQLPIGSYDMIVEFQSADGEGLYYVVKENVEVPCNDEIVFDPSTAVNHIEFRAVMPNGEEPVLNVGYYDDDWNPVITKQGNIDWYTGSSDLCHKKYGSLASNFGMQDMVSEGRDYPRNFDGYINNVSDNFYFSSITMLDTPDNFYAIFLASDEIKSHVVSNSKDSYQKVSEKIDHTPAAQLHNPEDEALPDSYKMEACVMNQITTNLNFSNNKSSGEMMVSYNCSELKVPGNNVRIGVAVDVVDAVVQEWIDFGEDFGFMAQYLYQIKTPSRYLSDNGTFDEYVVNKESLVIGAETNVEGKIEIYALPGNRAFNYSSEQMGIVFGNSAPTLTMEIMNYSWDDEIQVYCNPYYYGHLGEIRESDLVDLIVKKNDLNANVYTYSYENKNVRVDDIDGYNIADGTMSLQGECGYPSVQMLMFRDCNGIVTDRFASQNDGILEFAGGSFFFDSSRHYFSKINNVTAEVFWSVFGENNWQKLPVEEIPENYCVPGFGQFFSCSLGVVDKTSSNKWYDLKITLKNDVGDFQTQTISPAFKLEDIVLTGIELQTPDPQSCTEPEYYNLQGMRVAKPTQGITIVKYPDGIVRKQLSK